MAKDYQLISRMDKSKIIPGKNPGEMYIQFAPEAFRKLHKGDLLMNSLGYEYTVVRKYRKTWWSKVKEFFCIKFTKHNTVKIKM